MIVPVLNISSGHLTPATWDWLDSQLADPRLRQPDDTTSAQITGGRTTYGWFLYAPEDGEGLPSDLAAVCQLAHAVGANHVLLDVDAPPRDELPILHPDFHDT